VRTELSQRPPEDRIYAYDDPERPTPWQVPPSAKSLADCFLTSSAGNLLDTIERVLEFRSRPRRRSRSARSRSPGR
jgi:hypothetical protein